MIGSTTACAAVAIAIGWASFVGFVMRRAAHFRNYFHTD